MPQVEFYEDIETPQAPWTVHAMGDGKDGKDGRDGRDGRARPKVTGPQHLGISPGNMGHEHQNGRGCLLSLDRYRRGSAINPSMMSPGTDPTG